MPHLDAKALETDPEGLEFLRAVLRPAPKEAGKPARRSRRKPPAREREVARAEGAGPAAPGCGTID